MGAFLSTENQNKPSLPGDFQRRIVVLGKTGTGKSSLANTIFGEPIYETCGTAVSGTMICQAASKVINGKNIRFIDTPGFFDTERPEEQMKLEITKCMLESYPGPHAFIIVLKAEKYSEQEKEVVKAITDCFSKKILEYAVVLFTYGDQLEGQRIEDFVKKNKDLNDLVKSCSERCVVIDNKRWNKNTGDDYRSNQYQVERLLYVIDQIILKNQKSCYTIEMLPTKQTKSVTNKSLRVGAKILLQVCISGAMAVLINKEKPYWALGMALTQAIVELL